MHYEQYWMASDCPMCGQKDEHGKYKGARMSSTRWGHDYACCSDACGMALRKSAKFIELERAKLKAERDLLRRQEQYLDRLEKDLG